MQTQQLRAGCIAAVLAAAAVGAHAQTAARPAGASAPAAVGVSPQTAAAANEKAIPRSDTATVVRTGPTATERARNARPASTGDGATGSMQQSGSMQPTTTTGSAPLAAKPDRN